jgi:hypothetical protein
VKWLALAGAAVAAWWLFIWKPGTGRSMPAQSTIASQPPLSGLSQATIDQLINGAQCNGPRGSCAPVGYGTTAPGWIF